MCYFYEKVILNVSEVCYKTNWYNIIVYLFDNSMSWYVVARLYISLTYKTIPTWFRHLIRETSKNEILRQNKNHFKMKGNTTCT